MGVTPGWQNATMGQMLPEALNAPMPAAVQSESPFGDPAKGHLEATKPSPGANAERCRSSDSSMASAGRPTPSASRKPVDATRPHGPPADHAWVLRLLETEGPGILRLLWRLLGVEQDVLDAYQDTFCNLAMRGGARGLSHARAYAYRTAANVAIELIRVRKRRAAHLPAVAARLTAIQSDGGQDEPEVPVTERLREALDRLPVHLRNVVVLRDLSRMSYEEVGRTLGIGPATARVYRRHAVVKLAELLGEGQG